MRPFTTLQVAIIATILAGTVAVADVITAYGPGPAGGAPSNPIAFVAAADLGNNGGTTNTRTAAYTSNSGTNRLLVAEVVGDLPGGADDCSGGGNGVTYAGTSMTFLTKITSVTALARMVYYFYLLGPATGTNNVVVTCGTNHYILAGAADYTGVLQSGQPDVAAVTNNSTSAATTLTTSITSVTDNDWAILFESGGNGTNPPVASTGATRRAFDATFGGWGIFDSNGPITPPASYSMTTTRSGSTGNAIVHIAAVFKRS